MANSKLRRACGRGGGETWVCDLQAMRGRSVPYIKYIVFITRKPTIALNGIK